MGKEKPKKTKAATATSAFKGVNVYNQSSPFGGATATKQGDTISTTSSLSPQLQGIADNAITGLGAQQGFLNRTPDQQLQDLSAGNNSFYNLQKAIDDQNSLAARDAVTSRYAMNGMENSTARGGYDAQVTRDAVLQDLATRNAALMSQNQLAQTNGAFNAGLIDQMHNYTNQDAQAAGGQLMQGFQNVDQTAMFNAQQQNQMAQFNAQMAQQAAAQRSALMGNLIGSGLSLAAIPLTGGLSGLGGLFGAGRAMAGNSAQAAGIRQANSWIRSGVGF